MTIVIRAICSIERDNS